MRLYHRTRAEAAAVIVRGGFRDTTDDYGFRDADGEVLPLTGVWLIVEINRLRVAAGTHHSRKYLPSSTTSYSLRALSAKSSVTSRRVSPKAPSCSSSGTSDRQVEKP